MRLDLFRGKRRDNGEWIHWTSMGKLQSPQNGKLMSGNIGLTDWAYELLEIDDDTIGKYTGVYDEELTAICEGDVVELTRDGHTFRGTVVFECGAFGIGSRETLPLENARNDNFVSLWELLDDQPQNEEILDGCRVIGNIHDTPELLTVNVKNTT